MDAYTGSSNIIDVKDNNALHIRHIYILDKQQSQQYRLQVLLLLLCLQFHAQKIILATTQNSRPSFSSFFAAKSPTNYSPNLDLLTPYTKGDLPAIKLEEE